MVADEKKENGAEPSGDWEYEYEYVEVPEGAEMPEGEYEYEYVEVPEADAPLSENAGPEPENTEASEPVEIEEVDIDSLLADGPDEAKFDEEEIVIDTGEDSRVETEEIDITPEVSVEEETVEVFPENIEEIDEADEENLPEIATRESFTKQDIVEDNSDWSKLLNASIINLPPADYRGSVETAKIFTKSGGINVYQGTKDKNSLFIGDVNFDNDELNFWKLIVFDKKVIAVKNNAVERIPLLESSVRFARLIKSGEEKLALFNDKEFNFVSTADDFGLVDGKYIIGNADDDTNLMINDFIHIPVKKYAGRKIAFDNPQSGMLIGPDSSILYFADIKSVIIPDGVKHEVEEKDLFEVNLKWYSGNSGDNVFNISPATDATPVSGSSDIDTIHIQAGTTTYGWNVSFDNGIVMSIRDLQTYQRRNGSMPSEKGVLSYGAKKFEFDGIKRIVLYLSPQYFSYSK